MALTRSPRPSRRSARWLVPAGAATAVAVAVLAGQVGAAGADPVLPERSAAQLLAAVRTAHVDGLSGTVQTRADLGLPSLGAVTGGSSSGPTALSSGTHVLRVWTAGEDRARVAMNEQLAEYSVVRRGDTVYAYDSAKDTVTTKTLTPHAQEQPSLTTATTPQEAAQAALDAIGPTTDVTVDRTATVAGRSTYQLVLTPKDSQSLVGSVRIAVDSETSLPLRVQVFAYGADAPALQVGFTDLDLGVPADSVFAQPQGQQVTPPTGGAAPVAPSGPEPVTATVGTSWTTVETVHGLTVPAAAAPVLAAASTSVTVGGVAGHLVHTALVSALVLDDGRAYVGTVTPELLTVVATSGR